jgi:hypothetical protein
MRHLAIASLLFALGCACAFAADAPPNLEGVWGMVQHDRLGAPFFIPIEPKYTDEGKRITSEFMAKYDVKGNVTGELEANGHCVEPGMPTVMWGIGGAAMEIVQQDKRITLLSELAKQTRRIYLDGRDFPSDFPDQRVGFSIGHWEGDTLVVDVTDFNDETWFDRAGNFHSDQLHVVERYTLVDPDHINYEATIEDPKTFTRPWKMSMILNRHKEKNFRLLEYECFSF